MKFGIILFNLSVLIFVICLIYIFVYINYKYEGFASNDATDMGIPTQVTSTAPLPTESTSDINQLNSQVALVAGTITSLSTIAADGNSPDGAYPARIIPNLKKNFEAIKIATKDQSLQNRTFPDSYYWINFNSASAGQFIYCIMNEAYFGGGWMLAMRGTKGSTSFKYDSSYWTNAQTLNNDYSSIKTKLQELLNGGANMTMNEIRQNSELKNVSSMGNTIYKQPTNPNSHDTKTEAYISYGAREMMAIFYFSKDKAFAKGGDIIYANEGGIDEFKQVISSDNGNTRGWIWREKNLPLDTNGNPQSLLQIMMNAIPTSRKGSDANFTKFSDFYAPVAVSALDKLTKIPSLSTNLWSIKTGASYNFYGINHEVPGRPKVRWGFVFDQIVAGIGLSDKSAGDFNSGATTAGINDSVAFELYVR